MATRLKRLYLLSLLLFHFLFTYSLSLPTYGHPFAPLSSLKFYTFGYDKRGREGPGLLAPSSLVASLTAWSLGVLPLLVAAKWALSTRKAPATSTADASGTPGAPLLYITRVLKSSSAWVSAAFHAAGAAAIASVFWLCLLAYTHTRTSPWDARLAVPNRPGQHRPNEHVIYLLVSSALFGALFSLTGAVSRSLSRRRRSADGGEGSWATSAPRFDAASLDLSIGSRVRATLPRTLARGVSHALVLSGAELLAYLLLRRTLYRNLLSLIGTRSPLRALLIPSFRHRFLTPRFACTVALLHLFLVLAWSAAEALWAVYATQPIAHSAAAKDPTRCLVQGLLLNDADKGIVSGSSSAYYRHFAFAELCLLARGDSARRKAIFKDLSSMSGGRPLAPRPLLPGDTSASAAAAAAAANATPSHFGTTSITSSPVATPRRPAALAGTSTGNAWNVILGQCLEVLEKETAWAKRFGKAPPTRPTAASRGSGQGRDAGAGQATPQQQQQQGQASRNILKDSSTNVVNVPKPSLWEKLAEPSNKPAASSHAPARSATGAATPSGAQGAGGASASIWHKLAPSSSTAAGTAAQKVTAGAAKAAASPQAAATAIKGASLSDAISAAGSALVSLWKLIPASQRKRLAGLPVVSLLPALGNWLTSPSPSLVARNEVLRDQAALLTWAVVALSNLATASLQEDDYGVVQKDLPAVLLGGAELLSALEAWAEQLRSSARQRQEKLREVAGVSAASSSAKVLGEEARVSEDWEAAPGALCSTLREAISNILMTFQGYELDLRADEKALLQRLVAPTAMHEEEEEKADKDVDAPPKNSIADTSRGPEMREVRH